MDGYGVGGYKETDIKSRVMHADRGFGALQDQPKSPL